MNTLDPWPTDKYRTVHGPRGTYHRRIYRSRWHRARHIAFVLVVLGVAWFVVVFVCTLVVLGIRAVAS